MIRVKAWALTASRVKAYLLRLLTALINVLLDCICTFLASYDDNPGIVVTTIPELAAALMREDAENAYHLDTEAGRVLAARRLAGHKESPQMTLISFREARATDDAKDHKCAGTL